MTGGQRAEASETITGCKMRGDGRMSRTKGWMLPNLAMKLFKGITD